MADNNATDELALVIGRVSLGDRQAFSQLYRRSSPKLFAILVRILKNRSEAEDALQEVFMKIWQRAFRPRKDAPKPGSRRLSAIMRSI